MDDIQKIIQGGAKVLAKIFTGKELKEDLPVHINMLESEDIFAIAEGLAEDKRFSECEDYLFYYLEQDYDDALFNLGLSLIERIEKMDDNFLKENNYSKKEAINFKNDWLKLEQKNLPQ